MAILSSLKLQQMKKIIATTALLFALTLTANAQDAKRNEIAASKAKNEIAELHKLVNLNETQNTQLTMILEEKIFILEDKDLSNERKSVLSKNIESRLRRTLTPEQVEKLEKNQVLFNKLTH